QEDNAILRATFKDVRGVAIGVSSIGPVTPADRNHKTGLLFRSISADVPPGARTVEIILTMTRKQGGYNDGYADDVSFMLSGCGGKPNSPPSIRITQPLDGTVLSSGENISLTSDPTDLDGNVTNVAFYANSNVIGNTTNAPWSIFWTNVAIGNYSL